MARFRSATALDDPSLTRLSRDEMATPLGSFVLSRGGSLLRSLRQTYERSDIIVCEENDAVVGMGVRSIMRAKLFGEPVKIGYLNQLRSDKRARNRTNLVRAYKAMRDVVKVDGDMLCLSAILRDNTLARATLEGSGRAGMPAYHEIAQLRTFVFRESGVTRFAHATHGCTQAFSLSTADDRPYAWDQRGLRATSLQYPSVKGRLIGAWLLRSAAPLWTHEIRLDAAYLTNWENSPLEPITVPTLGFYALTLDFRDWRFARAQRYSCYSTDSILYGIQWDSDALIRRVANSRLPVYFDAGKL